MNQVLDIKMLKNPMDFDIGFSAIVNKDWKFHLVVFGKNNEIIKHATHISLKSARLSFYNNFSAGKAGTPMWANNKVLYSTGPDRQLTVDDYSGKFVLRKLADLFKGEKEENIKYYGTCDRIPADSQ